MRSKIITALVAATMSFGAISAYAASTIDSTKAAVTVVDPAAGTVSLNDGTSYQFPYGYDLSAVRPGQVVSIQWYESGDDRMGTTLN